MKQVMTLFLLMMHLQAFAWWDAGHLMVAQMAYEQLRPEVREFCDKLAPCLDPEEGMDFVSSACWADNFSNDFPLLFAFHREDGAVGEQGVIFETPGQLVEAIHECIHTLEATRNRKGEPISRWSKAFALRWLIHLVADAHQPLHCASLYSDDFESGDRFGLAFNIYAHGQEIALHRYWDSAAGLYTDRLPLPLDQAGLEQVAEWVEELGSESSDEIDPRIWTKESYALARDVVYQGISPGQEVTQDYQALCQQVCRQRLRLAGARLAALLNAYL